MKKNNSNDKSCNHSKRCGCGYTPEVFVNMIESAGLELSRREFIKGVL